MANMLVVTILLGVLTNAMVEYVSGILLDKAKENADYSVSQLALNVDNTLKVYEQLVDAFYINNDLQAALLKKYDSAAEAQAVYFDTVLPYMNVIRSTTDTLHLMIYTNNDTFQFSDVKLIGDEVRDTDWYQAASETKKRLSRDWMYMGRSDIYKADVLRLVGKLYNIFNKSEIFITVDVEQRIIENLTSAENKNQRTIIALSNGQVVVDHGSSNLNGLRLENYGFYDKIAGHQKSSQMYTENGRKYLLVSATLNARSSITGFKVVLLVPIDEYISKVNKLKWLALILYAASLGISFIFMYFISAGFTKRLTVLVMKIKEMNTDNLHSFIDVKGNDEITQVSHKFNQMMMRMDMLIKQVYEAEIQRKELQLKKRESELYALQTQINPHYLFNTLNAIRGNLLENGDRKNADIVKWFAQSFRNLLSRKGDIVPLGDELEMIDTYMRVQMFRYGKRLEYRCEVPAPLLGYPMLRLALHTIVENAIIHALEHNEGITVICISAEAAGGHSYRLTIADNGPGMTEERLKEIEAMIAQCDEEQQGTEHLGLLNTQQRIKLTFGEAYGLAIRSRQGEGTEVVMNMPSTWERQEE